MKGTIIIYLLCFCCTFKAYPIEDDIHTDGPLCKNEVADNRKYICYETYLPFESELSKLYSVCITEGDTVCDIFISVGNEKDILSIKCDKKPVLKWAFEEISVDFLSKGYIKKVESEPYDYNLSLLDDKSKITIDSSSIQINDNGDIAIKIEQLIKYITNLLFKLVPYTQSETDYTQNAYFFKEDNRRYIRYILGLQNICIGEGDKVCDVFIFDGIKKNIFLTTCDKTPILKWAFEEISDDFDSKRYIIEEYEYNPVYFNLSLNDNQSKIIVDAYSIHADVNDETIAKIKELKQFIFTLWVTQYLNLIKDH